MSMLDVETSYLRMLYTVMTKHTEKVEQSEKRIKGPKRCNRNNYAGALTQ